MLNLPLIVLLVAPLFAACAVGTTKKPVDMDFDSLSDAGLRDDDDAPLDGRDGDTNGGSHGSGDESAGDGTDGSDDGSDGSGNGPGDAGSGGAQSDAGGVHPPDGDPRDAGGASPDAGDQTGNGGPFPFASGVFASTHNSYMGEARGSFVAQLDDGIRALELDIHHDAFTTHGFRVGHDQPGHRVMVGQGNPATTSLTEWLRTVATWSSGHPGHAPITLIFDLKDNIGGNHSYAEGDLFHLNDLVLDAFGEKLLRADETKKVPEELPADIILAVLSGHRESRLAYIRDRGRSPAVAIDAQGRVVVVHASHNGGELWYWTGVLREDKGVRFYRHTRYDSGNAPAVALREDGLVVEVHEAHNDARLFYRVGRLGDDFEIAWYEEKGIQFPNGDNGRNPTLRFTGDPSGLRVREIHQSQNTGAIWYWNGEIDPSTYRINWTRGADGGRTDDPQFDKASFTFAEHTLQVLTGSSGPHGSDTLLYRINGGAPQRIRYEQVFFVEVQEGDGASLENDGLLFYAASAESSAGRTWAEARRTEGKMVRLWALNGQSRLSPVNYPATDVPQETWYRQYCSSLPCLR